MGVNNIGTANDGTIIPASDHNSIKEALAVDLVPRNTDGEPTADAGDLGTTTYPFKKARISAGYFSAGVIMPFHDFNGALSVPQGWVKCTGAVINEANYDALHGVGAWAKYIGTSPLDGKFTPNLTNKYMVGNASTSQDGSAPITSVGNASHQVTTSNHTHTIGNHNHQWYESSSEGQYYNSSGSLINLPAPVTKLSGTGLQAFGSGGSYSSADLHTSNNGAGSTSSNGSQVLNIKPESIEVQYLIRII